MDDDNVETWSPAFEVDGGGQTRQRSVEYQLSIAAVGCYAANMERGVYSSLRRGGVWYNVGEHVEGCDGVQRVVASITGCGVTDEDVERSNPLAIAGAVVVAYGTDVGVIVCAGVDPPYVAHLYRAVNTCAAVRWSALWSEADLPRVLVGMGVPIEDCAPFALVCDTKVGDRWALVRWNNVGRVDDHYRELNEIVRVCTPTPYR